MMPWKQLQHFWATTAFDVPTQSAREQDVRALEARYDLTLPDDFREYLLRASPADGNAYDDHFCLWWPLPLIKNIPDAYGGEVRNVEVAQNGARHLFFADHAMWAWAWVIACTEDENRGRIAIIGTESDQFVADDFATFVNLYVRDLFAVSPTR